MLQIPPSDMQPQGIAFLRPRRRRRTAWIAVGLAILLGIAGSIWTWHSSTHPKPIRLDISAKPPPLPTLQEGYMALAPAKAEEVNAGIALSTAPLEPSRPFNLPMITATNFAAHQSAVDCLTAAVYYEAASESLTGERAVAQVVLNRVRHPAFPKSVCGVVYEGSQRKTGCQFSFTCDGSLARVPSRAGWDRARGVAAAALAGYVETSVGTATHYHASYVVPYWAWTLDKVNVIGAHIFYRWKGYWGKRAAFTGAYAGEPAGDEEAGLMPLMPADSVVPDDSLSVPLGPRPLADDLGRIAAGPAPSPSTGAAVRADQEKGTLAADDKAGALIHSGPDASPPAN